RRGCERLIDVHLKHSRERDLQHLIGFYDEAIDFESERGDEPLSIVPLLARQQRLCFAENLQDAGDMTSPEGFFAALAQRLNRRKVRAGLAFFGVESIEVFVSRKQIREQRYLLRLGASLRASGLLSANLIVQSKANQ